MAALREAISMAQENNDHVCLQHALVSAHVKAHYIVYIAGRSLPYVSSGQFSSKTCKKISIIGFEIQVIFKTGSGKKKRKKKYAVV